MMHLHNYSDLLCLSDLTEREGWDLVLAYELDLTVSFAMLVTYWWNSRTVQTCFEITGMDATMAAVMYCMIVFLCCVIGLFFLVAYRAKEIAYNGA